MVLCFFVTDIFGPDSDAVLWVFIPAHWSLVWLTASIFIPLHHLVVGSTGTGSSILQIQQQEHSLVSLDIKKKKLWTLMYFFLLDVSGESREETRALIWPEHMLSFHVMLTNNTLQLHLWTNCNAVKVKTPPDWELLYTCLKWLDLKEKKK